MTKQRITLISLVGLLVLVLLLGGQILYKKNWIDANLLHSSQQIAGVQSAKIVEVNGQQELDVVTNNMTNLREATIKLEELAGKLPIRFLDQRDPQLTALFDQMQFALQEGIARGNFTEMEQIIKKQAQEAGVKLGFTMDNDNLYLTLTKGKSQLVEVLERHDQGQFLPGEINK